MKNVLSSLILTIVPFCAMAQVPTAEQIKQNLPASEISLQAKSAGIYGYEITVSYVNHTKHTVYMPSLGLGTTTLKGYVKHGSSYKPVSVRAPLMQIRPSGERLTEFRSLAPGAKDSFTIYLNSDDIEGRKSPSKFSLTWSVNLVMPDRTAMVLRLKSNTALVKN